MPSKLSSDEQNKNSLNVNFEISNETKENFLLERYKYILLRKNDLNGKTFKVLTYYQALLIAMGSALYAIVKMNIAEQGRIFGDCLIMLFIIISLFLTLLLTGGIFAWLDIRKDERELLISVIGIDKGRIKKRDILTWYELYICLALITASCGLIFAYYHFRSVIFI
ncbi:MAG: hypothetical protein ACRCTW_11730 [Lactococcus garvieae]